jgi:hypothetical protein
MSGRNHEDAETTSTLHRGAFSQMRLRHTESEGWWERISVILGGVLPAAAVIYRLFF